MAVNDIPNGSLQAISTGASAALALEIAFLGYWAFGSQTGGTPWHWIHLFGLVPLGIAFYYLASVPHAASSEEITTSGLKAVRGKYKVGMSALAIGIAISMALSVGSWYDRMVGTSTAKAEPASFICSIRQ